MENSVILEEILEELTENAKHISSSSLEKFANEIIKARHIFVAGAGRSAFVVGSILCGRTDNTGNLKKRSSYYQFRFRRN